LRELDLEIGCGVRAAGEPPALLDFNGGKPVQVVRGGDQRPVEYTNPAAFAAALSAAGELDAVGEEQIVERGAGVDPQDFPEGQQYDLDLALGFHGVCWWA
jgi:hypothetical protein